MSVIPQNPWGEGRRAFILTNEQIELIAAALERYAERGYEHPEAAVEQAAALATQFRTGGASADGVYVNSKQLAASITRVCRKHAEEIREQHDSKLPDSGSAQ